MENFNQDVLIKESEILIDTFQVIGHIIISKFGQLTLNLISKIL